MSRILAALLSGLLFGLGLVVARMVDPAKVLGFLDVAGRWDPSLAFVLMGAIGTAAAGFRLIEGRRLAPLLAPRFELPAKQPVDRRLVAGSAIFGVGWGLAGLCPGPALAGLSLDPRPLAVFVVAMLAGMALFGLVGKAPAVPDAAAVPGPAR